MLLGSIPRGLYFGGFLDLGIIGDLPRGLVLFPLDHDLVPAVEIGAQGHRHKQGSSGYQFVLQRDHFMVTLFSTTEAALNTRMID